MSSIETQELSGTLNNTNSLRGTLNGDNNLSGVLSNARSGGSSGGGVTHILDFTEFFNRMNYPSVVNTDIQYSLRDMVSWEQISQEFLDKLFEDFSKIDNNNIGVIGIANITYGNTDIEYPVQYSFQDYGDGWIDRIIVLKRELREGDYIKTYLIEIYFGEEYGVPYDINITVTYMYKLQTVS